MRSFLLIPLVLVMSLEAPAAAQARDPVAAERLFRDGRNDMKQKRYGAACEKFAESQRLDPAPGTVLNLAQCEEHLGRFASAWRHYQNAVEQMRSDDPRFPIANAGLASVEPRVPKVRFRLPSGAPQETVVVCDDAKLAPDSLGLEMPLDPGEHLVVTSSPGREAVRYTFTLGVGETRVIDLRVGAAHSPTAPPSSRTDEIADDGARRRERWGYGLGAGGLVAIGMGTYFTLDARSKDNEAQDYCDGTVCRDQRGVDLTDEARQRAKYGIVSFVVGGLALSGSALLLGTSVFDGATEKEPAVSVGASGGPGFVGLDVGGAW